MIFSPILVVTAEPIAYDEVATADPIAYDELATVPSTRETNLSPSLSSHCVLERFFTFDGENGVFGSG